MPSFIKDVSQLKPRMTKLRITDSFFSDVPLGHWAAGAVTEMGRKGLLKGYPGKKFKGSDLPMTEGIPRRWATGHS